MKIQWKIIVPILIMAMLVATFYFGGNAPGSTGWEVGGNEPAVSITPDTNPTPTPVQDNTPELTPTPAPDTVEQPDNTPDSTPDNTPDDTQDNTVDDTQDDTQEVSQPTMEIDPETGKDKYQTDPVPEGKPLPVEPQDVTIGSTALTCTMSINCSMILNNMDLCDPAKVDFVPADGWILQPITVTFYEGESVFNVLQRVCKQQKIHMEFENTPIYNSAYIEGINNLYEFDVGELSGWMYKVNEWFPNYGCSRYALEDGDVICWVYTCDLGNDVGGGYSTGNGMS